MKNLSMAAKEDTKVKLVLLNVLLAKSKALVKMTTFFWQLYYYKCRF